MPMRARIIDVGMTASPAPARSIVSVATISALEADMSNQGWQEFLAAEDVADWVVLHGGAMAVFRVPSLAGAVRLAEAVADVPGLDGAGALTCLLLASRPGSALPLRSPQAAGSSTIPMLLRLGRSPTAPVTACASARGPMVPPVPPPRDQNPQDPAKIAGLEQASLSDLPDLLTSEGCDYEVAMDSNVRSAARRARSCAVASALVKLATA
jgi:hypothetical protein